MNNLSKQCTNVPYTNVVIAVDSIPFRLTYLNEAVVGYFMPPMYGLHIIHDSILSIFE